MDEKYGLGSNYGSHNANSLELSHLNCNLLKEITNTLKWGNAKAAAAVTPYNMNSEDYSITQINLCSSNYSPLDSTRR
jgi:hypothetical protein